MSDNTTRILLNDTGNRQPKKKKEKFSFRKLFNSIVITLNELEENFVTKLAIKRVMKKYSKLYYVPCMRKFNNQFRGHFRLYGERRGRTVLCWEGTSSGVLNSCGIDIEMESPYDLLDNTPV